MNINFDNVFASGALTPESFKSSGDLIPDYLDKISARDQGFYQIFDQVDFVDEVKRIGAYSASVEGQYEDIVICGIGGSALGTITLRDALMPLFVSASPQLHVVENIDPDMMVDIVRAVDLSKTLVIVISKSGGTPETLAQYFYFRNLTDQAGLTAKDHFVFITGPTGFLAEVAVEEFFPTFSVPENVGGRFSVLTAVGLLPAALIGINIRELLSGGKKMVDQFLNKNFDQNLPFQLAVIQFLTEKPQHVLMPYATKLRSLAAWFAQLLAESTGKGGKGLTPIPALGVTDQHSQVQLFSDGPNDKLLLFIKVAQFVDNPEIPMLKSSDKTDFLEGITFADLLHAEQSATAMALTEKKKPNLTIEVPEISAEILGQLFVLFEGATAFLGEFMEINAFDQPGVERGKVLTREFLGEVG